MAADESTLEKTNASSSGTPQQSRDERQRHGSGASDRDQRTVAKTIDTYLAFVLINHKFCAQLAPSYVELVFFFFACAQCAQLR